MTTKQVKKHREYKKIRIYIIKNADILTIEIARFVLMVEKFYKFL